MALNDGSNDGRRTIESKDQWLESMKRKHNTKQEDKETLKPKKFDLHTLATGYVDMPKKVSIIGQPGETSNRPAKTWENK